MTASLARMLSRDFDQERRSSQYASRESSMYSNFTWLKSRLVPGTKVIVWGATVHLAHRAPESKHDGIAILRFGDYLRRGQQGHVFALGFSAFSGTYGRRQTNVLPAAPADSIEAKTFVDRAATERYLDKANLQTIGEAPGRVLAEDFHVARWAEAIDGLVMFREDRPPDFLD
jgi:erythromycin esterase-like protein